MEPEINYEIAIKYLNNSATDAEKAAFIEWLNDSDKNRLQLDSFQKYWELTGKAFKDFEPDIELAWGKVKKQTLLRKKITIRYFYRVAIAVIIIFSLGLGIKLYQKSEFYYRHKLISSITTDKIKEIKLEDGSVIWLNANSRLEVPLHFSANHRLVYLTGEAFFEIAKDADKPFLIKSKSTITEVLGTSFNIRAKENESDIKVTVTTGKVAFYSTKDISSKVYLTPGMQGIWNAKSEKIVTSSKTDINYLSWKTGILKFNNTPLEKVCNIISNNYNINISIDPEQSSGYLFTGNFDSMKLDPMLDIIATTLDIKFVKSEDQIEVEFK